MDDILKLLGANLGLSVGLPVALIVVRWLVSKFLIPWLAEQSQINRLKYAKHLVELADSITDDWIEHNPSTIAKWFDDCVHEIREAVDDLKEDTAKNLIREAIGRKKADPTLPTPVLDTHDFVNNKPNGK